MLRGLGIHHVYLPRPSAFYKYQVLFFDLVDRDVQSNSSEVLLQSIWSTDLPTFLGSRHSDATSSGPPPVVDGRIRGLKSEVGPSGGGLKVLESHTQVRQVGLSVGANLTTYRLIRLNDQDPFKGGLVAPTYRVLPSVIPLYDVIARGAVSHSSEQCEVGDTARRFNRCRLTGRQ